MVLFGLPPLCAMVHGIVTLQKALPCYGDICMHRGQINVIELASLHSQSEVWSAVINWDVSDRNLLAK